MRQLVICFFLFIVFASCNQPNSSKPVDIVRNGLQISYNSCGDADTSLLFVHGWCINKEYWEPQLNYFCARYKIVAIDLPGFGQSGKNRTAWNFDEYTEDIKAVIEQLHLKNVILIGHSMSGDLILNVSNKYPRLLAGIVGVDNLHEPGSPMSTDQQKETAAFFNMLSSAFDSTVNRYLRPPLFQPSTDTAIVNRVMNSVFTTDSAIAISVLRSVVDISQKEKQLMQGLSNKLYLVNSDLVPIKTDSLLKYCGKGFHAELVHGTSHYPMIEKPADFNKALQNVIDSIGK
ncbi:MAG: alpha/beta hydrolase [Chitinophagaceae bacterium]